MEWVDLLEEYKNLYHATLSWREFLVWVNKPIGLKKYNEWLAKIRQPM
jgi:hypothetical protein